MNSCSLVVYSTLFLVENGASSRASRYYYRPVRWWKSTIASSESYPTHAKAIAVPVDMVDLRRYCAAGVRSTGGLASCGCPVLGLEFQTESQSPHWAPAREVGHPIQSIQNRFFGGRRI